MQNKFMLFTYMFHEHKGKYIIQINYQIHKSTEKLQKSKYFIYEI